MSGEAIGYKEIKKCRKNHTCFWCGETIKCGESYRRWCWADDGLEEIKVHWFFGDLDSLKNRKTEWAGNIGFLNESLPF